jgi:porin
MQSGYEPKLGRDRLPGPYIVGLGYDSSCFKSFSSALAAASWQASASHNGNTQVWGLADQMLVRSGEGGDQDGILALAGFVSNNPDYSTYGQQYSAGLLDRGFWRARPEDGIGLLFTYIAMSRTLAKVQAEEADLGVPLGSAATGVQTHEMILEATSISTCGVAWISGLSSNM